MNHNLCVPLFKVAFLSICLKPFVFVCEALRLTVLSRTAALMSE